MPSAPEPVEPVFESGGQLNRVAPLLYSSVQLWHVVHYEGYLVSAAECATEPRRSSVRVNNTKRTARSKQLYNANGGGQHVSKKVGLK